MRKQRLYTPGPTPIPPDVVRAMAQPIEYHRSDAVRAVVKDIERGLKYVFQTEHDVAILASSGTGAMECAIVNLCSPGDTVLAIRSGKFGERWAEIATAYELNVVPIDVEWGHSVDPALVQRALDAHPQARLLLSTLCETSTGALHDIRALAALTSERDTLLVVDAVSALGADEIRMDAWNVDALVSCSQKGLMTPPGLAFCAFGTRALRAMDTATLPRYYFDFGKLRASLEKNETPFTPAVSLLYGLRQALQVLREETLEQVLQRHARLAVATRNAAKALGLHLFAQRPANTVTALRLPNDVDGRALVSRLQREEGVVIAGGQGRLGGKIIRIAHLGWMDDYDVIAAIAAVERGLRDSGVRFPIGAGVAAAHATLAGSPDAKR